MCPRVRSHVHVCVRLWRPQVRQSVAQITSHMTEQQSLAAQLAAAQGERDATLRHVQELEGRLAQASDARASAEAAASRCANNAGACDGVEAAAWHHQLLHTYTHIHTHNCHTVHHGSSVHSMAMHSCLRHCLYNLRSTHHELHVTKPTSHTSGPAGLMQRWSGGQPRARPP